MQIVKDCTTLQVREFLLYKNDARDNRIWEMCFLPDAPLLRIFLSDHSNAVATALLHFFSNVKIVAKNERIHTNSPTTSIACG